MRPSSLISILLVYVSWKGEAFVVSGPTKIIPVNWNRVEALPQQRKRRSSLILAALGPKVSNGNPNNNNNNNEESQEENFAQRLLRRLAELSLQDFEWRSGVFKSNEADRMLEDSLARMRGQADSPKYIRPMDAAETKVGPLGRWEKNAVNWLSQVIQEEGRRAELIVISDGKVVRPKDTAAGAEELGPLGFLERQVVDFLESIRNAEMERVKTNTFRRPKDVDEAMRGPLGKMEFEAVRILQEIQESEKLRMQQSRTRGGQIVRPIDVPGPLGEFEMKVLELFDAEQKRSKERETSGHIVRPKDAKVRGPLGEAELQVFETIQQMSLEERQRLDSIRCILQENRPMNNQKDSLLGIFEAIIVGIVRAPIMLVNVIKRVQELLESEQLADDDKKVIQSERSRSSRALPSLDDDDDDERSP